MNRRSFFELFAAVPFVGVFASAAVAAPVETKTWWPAKDIYARAGEIVTCENGHPICEFVENVFYGQIQDVTRQFGNWWQEQPKIGEFPIRGCTVCGAMFTTGMVYHIGDSWRERNVNHFGASRTEADGSVVVVFDERK